MRDWPRAGRGLGFSEVMLIQFWCNGIISNQVRSFVCSPSASHQLYLRWKEWWKMTTIFCHYESSKLNFSTLLVTGMHSKKLNNPFASLNWEERLHCLESHSRGQYFSWPGHGDVTQCHAVTINNTNVTLSQMDKSCPDIARQSPFIDCRTETSWSALSPGVSGFVNAQCLFTGNDRSNAKIQNQLVPCPKSRLGMLLV